MITNTYIQANNYMPKKVKIKCFGLNKININYKSFGLNKINNERQDAYF